MRKLIVLISVTALTACATNEAQIQDVLQKNPQILFNVIEENPELFIEVVNKAAQKAQKSHYEKQISSLKAQQENEIKNPLKPMLSEDRRLVGDTHSKIVVVEYADFQCPACRMAFDSINQFKEKYKNQVQFYYKHMPLNFHNMALPAALYFEAVRLQDKAKALKFYDAIFLNQSELKDEEFLKKTAKKVGADLKKLSTDIKSEKVKTIVAQDMAEFEKFGFTGTPVILVNGVAIHGGQKMEELERVARLTGSL